MSLRSIVHRTRIGTSCVGVSAVFLLGYAGRTSASGLIAGCAIALLTLTALLAGIELTAYRQRLTHKMDITGDTESPERSRAGLVCAGVVAVVAFIALQTWFVVGTAIAGGDISPPTGTAWISNMFAPWAWTGSSLGTASATEVRSPWAAVLWIVTASGGSSALAQRIWLTALFVAAGLACFALLRILHLSPIAAALGALVYLFNPYVVSTVGTNDVFLAGLVLLAAFPACVLAVATKRWRIRTGVLVLALCAPLLGFAYENPPLVGMVLLLTISSAGLAAWLHGSTAAWRATRVLLFGLPLLFAASAYWIVPSGIQLHDLASSQLSSISTWGFTEVRASLANGLWLNTAWGWRVPEYFPYAHLYSGFPLAVLKYLLPATAFASLTLAVPAVASRRGIRRGRLMVAASALALFLIVLGTGTNLPGALIFDPLYHLPFGWLLQQPGRFLMAAGLAYGILVGGTVEAVLERHPLPRLREAAKWQFITLAWRRGGLGVTALLILAPGWPLATGVVVPSHRTGDLPASHVRVPTYWISMAAFLNGKAPRSNLLVLPTDDFYAMPYDWGYYGNDGFITDLIRRHVLDPSEQGYDIVSNELVTTVQHVSTSLLAGDWQLCRQLVIALGTSAILVRGDISANFPGRSIISASALGWALHRDPYFRLVHRSGPLELFMLRTNPIVNGHLTRYVTVNTSVPDLSALGLFPPGTALVTSRPRAGVAGLFQLPPVETWHLHGQQLTTTLAEPAGWRYRVAELSPGSEASVVAGSPQVSPKPPYIQHRTITPTGSLAHFAVPVGANQLPDGNFRDGGWGPVGNCAAFPGTLASAGLRARVLSSLGPGGIPALELSAQSDSACESRHVDWHSGSLLISLWVRDVRGASPSVCLWEFGPNHCAQLPPLPNAVGWQRYQTIVTPDPGTTNLSLFLYAQVFATGQPATDEYAGAEIMSMDSLLQPVVVAIPLRPAHSHPPLIVSGEAYSAGWTGPAHASHLLVDGLRNGWLGGAPTTTEVVRYTPAQWDLLSRWVSIACFLVLLGLASSVIPWVEHRRTQHAGPAGHL